MRREQSVRYVMRLEVVVFPEKLQRWLTVGQSGCFLQQEKQSYEAAKTHLHTPPYCIRINDSSCLPLARSSWHEGEVGNRERSERVGK